MVSQDLNITFRALDEALGASCAPMTFPAYRHLLALRPSPRHPDQGDTRLVEAVGVVAMAGETAVGLALAEIPLDVPETAELLSLFVVEPLRGQGIGTALVAAVERELAARGATRVEAVYMTGRPAIATVERVFAKRGWDAPVVRTVTVRFTPEEARTTTWYGKIPLPRHSEIVAWKDVTEQERLEIQRSHQAKPWIDAGLEPWAHDRQGYDEASSVGLRHKGMIVGWVINHLLPDKTVRFTCSFMRHDLAGRAAILPLYTASIERVRQSGGRWCMFITPVSYAGMVDFVRTRCAAWVSFVGETRGVTKALTEGRHA